MTTCKVKVGVGKDSKRFLSEDSSKPCVMGGIIFEDAPGFASDSDGDVILQSICHAITSLTGVSIIAEIAADLCYKNGITDSQVYLEKALEILSPYKIEHVALSIEGKRPKTQEHVLLIREKIASILSLSLDQIGLTVCSGDGLTDFGCGQGVQCFCVLTVYDSK